MEHYSDDVTAGARVNTSYVVNMKEEHSDLETMIPESCRDCSTAWAEAHRGREYKLKECPGRQPISLKIGENAFSLMACHLPVLRESLEEL